ncbi:MAG: sugar ABC transporter substrate-binding protein, partial [Armatimonadetes bacterium]|nr:sugar ABC transporter substrate-binding protein [Armatimonadota bacterium]
MTPNRVLVGLLLGLSLGATVVLVGCPPKEEPASVAPAIGPKTEAPAPNETPLLVQGDPSEEYVAIGISTGAEYWNATRAGLDDVCAELGVAGKFEGPLEHRPDEQANILDQAIARKPAGIMIAPGNPETLKPYIDKAIDAGINVICIDTDSPDSRRLAYYGTSNYEAGCTGARILATTLKSRHEAAPRTEYKVVLSTRPGQWNLDERVRGYKETLAKEAPEVKVVQVIDDETKYEVGQKQAGAMLAKYPDLAGFAGMNAFSGPGVARAVQAAQKSGEIVIVAMDGDTPILDLIQDGTITASVAQRQYYMTYIGVKYLFGLKHGLFRKP